MDQPELGDEALQQLQRVLGYLNFSSGKSEPSFLQDLDRLYRWVEESDLGGSAYQEIERLLRASVDQLPSETLGNSDQANAVINLVFQHVLPDYRRFHEDSLYHQTEDALFGPFFLGRVFEFTLANGAPWESTTATAAAIISRLNDYVGHRPVATLETHEMEPYAHEWICPIPLYIQEAGPCLSPYQRPIEIALELLQNTDHNLLRQACFDPDLLRELAMDPRAYDFDHPVNRRPNYHFGQWDPHQIDNRGHYRRYVIQQVTLDALVSRIT